MWKLRHYILKGHTPVQVDNLLDWAEAFEKQDRQVAVTMIGEVRVSTVFLGLDHSWMGGPPLLFETMVFGGPLDQEMRRYSTWTEAEEGHRAMVEWAKVGEIAE